NLTSLGRVLRRAASRASFRWATDIVGDNLPELLVRRQSAAGDTLQKQWAQDNYYPTAHQKTRADIRRWLSWRLVASRVQDRRESIRPPHRDIVDGPEAARTAAGQHRSGDVGLLR